MPARKQGRTAVARRGALVRLADPVEARGRRAQIDDGEEERGQRVDAEMRADPWQAQRQSCGHGSAAQPEACIPAATARRATGIDEGARGALIP